MKRTNINKLIAQKIFIKIMLILFCIIFIITSLFTFHITRNVNLDSVPKNIILLIGDGMGENHIKIAKEKFNIDLLNMETLPQKGKVTTFSKKFKTTDSAAAASAIATGKKTYNKTISQNKNSSNNETITELAIKNKMNTGIITSAYLYDATPAAFSSHTSSRKNYDDIIMQQICSEINIMIGAGKKEYDKYDNFDKENKLYINNINDAPKNISKNFICAFDNISSNNELDNSLLSCSKYAIDVLSKSDGNFFLIIEGGKIDWESHNNNIDNMINELLAFDEVVEYCLNYAKNQPDTCVLVTADHETGGLLLPKTGEIISDNLFTTSSHTGKLVEYYFYPEGINDMPYLIDNTYIYKLLYEIISNN